MLNPLRPLVLLVLASGCSFMYPPVTGFTTEQTSKGMRVRLDKERLAVTLSRTEPSDARHCSYRDDCWEVGRAQTYSTPNTTDLKIYTRSPVETLAEAKVNARTDCLQSEVISGTDTRDSFELLSTCLQKDLQTWFIYGRWLKNRPGAECGFEGNFEGAKAARRACASFESVAEAASLSAKSE